MSDFKSNHWHDSIDQRLTTDRILKCINSGQMALQKSDLLHILSQRMEFPTMWYVQSVKPQISLRIRAV